MWIFPCYAAIGELIYGILDQRRAAQIVQIERVWAGHLEGRGPRDVSGNFFGRNKRRMKRSFTSAVFQRIPRKRCDVLKGGNVTKRDSVFCSPLWLLFRLQ
jgi:hypothetical protein